MIALRLNIAAAVCFVLVFGGFVGGDAADISLLAFALFFAVSALVFALKYEKKYQGYNLTVSSCIIGFMIFSVFWIFHMHAVMHEELEKRMAEMKQKVEQMKQENQKKNQENAGK